MKKISLFIISGLFFLSLSACERRTYTKVCFKSTCISAELAQTGAQRKKGLMFRKSLAPDKGMFFIFDEERPHGIWMKNMRFALDIIFLNGQKQVVAVKENALPCKEDCPTFRPPVVSKYALEVVAGFVSRHQVKVGDQANFLKKLLLIM